MKVTIKAALAILLALLPTGSAAGAHFLTKGHPLYSTVTKLCQNPSTFRDVKHLKKKFKIVNEKTRWDWQIYLLGSSKIKGYFLKKYLNGDPSVELKNYSRRQENADILRAYIKKKGFSTLAVPRKWVVECRDKNGSLFGYALLVEDMDICPGNCKCGETQKRYLSMSKQHVTELCTTLYDLKGCDAWPRNQPFTFAGTIAFIDTEKLGQSGGDWIHRMVKYINPAWRQYGIDLWDSLAAETAK